MLRLTDKEIEIIKKVIYDVFGDSEIIVFGSRLKEKKGGDIDLFVIPKKRNNLFKKKIKASAKLELLLYKPVDIVVHYDFSREIEKEAIKGVKI
ncbi:nucleotidyltransferase family protein [Caminibacter sp.]